MQFPGFFFSHFPDFFQGEEVDVRNFFRVESKRPVVSSLEYREIVGVVVGIGSAGMMHLHHEFKWCFYSNFLTQLALSLLLLALAVVHMTSCREIPTGWISIVSCTSKLQSQFPFGVKNQNS